MRSVEVHLSSKWKLIIISDGQLLVTECDLNTVTLIKMFGGLDKTTIAALDDVQLLALFVAVTDVPGLGAGFGFDPPGFDAEEVDLFLDSNSSFSSCFQSSSLSFSFFFSLK